MCRNKTPEWARQLLWSQAEINYKMEILMSLVSVDSDALAQLDTDLKAAATSIGDRIQALVDAGVAIPAGDLSALQADVAALQGLEAPPATA